MKSCLFKEFGRFAKGKKVTVTSYPNIFSKTKFVKRQNLPYFSKLDNNYPLRLQFSNRYNTLKYKESIGPASDAINFKKCVEMKFYIISLIINTSEDLNY